jgi:hypothetical protein
VQGLRLSIDLSSSTSEFISNKTIGVVTEDISRNGEGFVTTSGMVRGVNTTGDLQGENWQQVIYYTLVALSMEVLLIYYQ